MVTVILRSMSSSFATRERARTIVDSLPYEEASDTVVDVADVRASPSFIAEILTLLANRGRVKVVGADDFQRDIIGSLIARLQLSDRVTQVEFSHS